MTPILQRELAPLRLQQTDGYRTLISAIFDLQNQAVTVPERAGFFERRVGTPNLGHCQQSVSLNALEQGRR